MARKRKPKLSDTDRENMLARAESLMKDVNRLHAVLNPNCDDYLALEKFYNSTRRLSVELSGNPNYLEHIGSGLHGLGSSRER